MAIFYLPYIRTSNDGWSDPTKAQYHIQTDEGPERYFRYQTLSGQYRKEKRLEDGTVIGTYGWVDDDGFLRMREYIADNAGYRILKTKNVFVGRNRPINQALTIAKKAPAEEGSTAGVNTISKVASTQFYTKPSTSYSTPTLSQETYSTYTSPSNTQILPIGYSAQHLQAPVFKFGTFTIPQSTLDYTASTPTPPIYDSRTPTVEVSLNSVPSSTESSRSFSTVVPSTTILPPDVPSSTPSPGVTSSTPATVYIPSTTPVSTTASSAFVSSSTPNYNTGTASYKLPATNYGSPILNTISSTPKYNQVLGYSPTNNYIAAPTVSTLQPPLNSNHLSDSLYSSDPQYEHYSEDQLKLLNPYVFQNGPTYPIDKKGNTYNGHNNNNLGSGYNTQFSQYDGISVTNDGFRYYIPKQYHEEHNLPNNEKTGSFGYIDPFGIRRVVYYNAGPDGFKHRKNNRYVGSNATPYDPRPY